MQPVATRLATDGGGREEGALQQDILGAVADGGLRAAHDAGQGQRACLVGDHQGIVAQRNGVSVQQRQRLARMRHTDLDAAV